MELFKFDKGELVVDHKEVRLYEPFNKIFSKDPSPTKVNANAIMKYIWLKGDPKSVCNIQGLTGNEAHNFAKKHAGLPDGFLLTNEIEKAVDFYRDCKANVILDTVNELVVTLRLSLKMVRKIKKVYADKIDDTSVQQSDSEIGSFVSLQEKLFKITENIPKYIQSLEEVKKIVLTEEDAAVEETRGGGIVRPSYEGDENIENV
jgi:hypothetical protein